MQNKCISWLQKNVIKNQKYLVVSLMISNVLLILCILFTTNIESNEKSGAVTNQILIENSFNQNTKEVDTFKNNLLDNYFKYLDLFEPKEMRITCYTSKPHELNALGKKPIVGKSCAVSRDRYELLGKKVYIQGEGIFIVDDLCDSHIKNTLDIYTGGPETRKSCLEFGAHNKKVSPYFFHEFGIVNRPILLPLNLINGSLGFSNEF
jgi:3D (Asp-Asp-Asp) domain-containing protein